MLANTESKGKRIYQTGDYLPVLICRLSSLTETRRHSHSHLSDMEKTSPVLREKDGMGGEEPSD
jgi:hypothetical protein